MLQPTTQQVFTSTPATLGYSRMWSQNQDRKTPSFMKVLLWLFGQIQTQFSSAEITKARRTSCLKQLRVWTQVFTTDHWLLSSGSGPAGWTLSSMSMWQGRGSKGHTMLLEKEAAGRCSHFSRCLTDQIILHPLASDFLVSPQILPEISNGHFPEECNFTKPDYTRIHGILC